MDNQNIILVGLILFFLFFVMFKEYEKFGNEMMDNKEKIRQQLNESIFKNRVNILNRAIR